MRDILKELKNSYPLLEVRNPEIPNDIPWEFRTPKAPEGLYELMHEFFARYTLVGYKSRKGEPGAQVDDNHIHIADLRLRIKTLYPKGWVSFKFYNLFIIAKINFKKASQYEQIRFKVIQNITPSLNQ